MFPFNWLVITENGRVRGFRLKLDVQGQGDGRILDVAGQEGGGSWKLHNFHGGHSCIVLKQSKHSLAKKD